MAGDTHPDQADPDSCRYDPPVCYESLEALHKAHQILVTGNTAVPFTKIAITKDGQRFLYSEKGDQVIPRKTHLGSAGGGTFVDSVEGLTGMQYILHDKDATLVELETSADEGGSTTSFIVDTFYNIIRKLEREGYAQILDKVEKTTCEREIVDGKDCIKISYPTSSMFKFINDPKANKASAKWIFTHCPSTLPSDALGIAWRYRVERVGKSLKLMKPYVVTKMALTLKENKPIKAWPCNSSCIHIMAGPCSTLAPFTLAGYAWAHVHTFYMWSKSSF